NPRRVIFRKLQPNLAALTDLPGRILDDLLVNFWSAIAEIGDGYAVSVHAAQDIELPRRERSAAIGVRDVANGRRAAGENRGNAVLAIHVDVRSVRVALLGAKR